jgi:hypothetical protein
MFNVSVRLRLVTGWRFHGFGGAWDAIWLSFSFWPLARFSKGERLLGEVAAFQAYDGRKREAAAASR